MDSIDMEFGCFLCSRPGIVVNTCSINKWGRLIVASIKSIYPVISMDVEGAAEKGTELAKAIKECICDKQNKILKAYTDLGNELNKSRHDMDTSAYISPDDEKELHEKLVSSGFYQFYSPSKAGSFIWKCSGECWPKT